MVKEESFTNEKGITWTIEKTATQYAASLKLKDCVVCRVKYPEKNESYVIVENGEATFESQSLDTIGARLDIISLLRRH